MKKILTVLCMLALFLCMNAQVFAAGNVSLAIDTVTAKAGESVEVPIRISGNTGICGAQIIITYDNDLKLTGVKAGNAWTSLTLTKPGNLSANPVTLVWDGTDADSSEGIIAVLTFIAPKEAGTYRVSASYEEGCIVDGDINPVQVNIKNGAIICELEEAVNPFVDISSSNYYYDAVLWALDKNITQGKDATHFQPTAECTRAQVVTFLWRAKGCPEPKTTENPFVDVPSNAFYYKAVLWAFENGITTGKDATHFQPSVTVDRSQFVTFLWRTEGKPAPTIKNPFEDVQDGKYYTNAVLWAFENGITTGKDKTHFQPTVGCQRCQVVTFLYRAYK